MNPSRLDPVESVDFCGACHRTWEDVVTNIGLGALNLRFAPYRLENSKCWGKPDARLKVLILAPNDGNIWAANPFCAVPSPFRVEARGKTYWGICIWDALGIVAALGTDAVIRTACGDCSEPMLLEIAAGRLKRSEGIVHFAVPAHHWWDNIGFT